MERRSMIRLDKTTSPTAGEQSNQPEIRHTLSRPHSLEGVALPLAGGAPRNHSDFHRLGSPSLEGSGSPPAGNATDIGHALSRPPSRHELVPLSERTSRLAGSQENRSDILRLHLSHSLPDLTPSAGGLDLPISSPSLPERASSHVELPGSNRSGDRVSIEMHLENELLAESLTEHQRDTSANLPDLGINTDKLFAALGITEDPQQQRVALDRLADIKRTIEELAYMGAPLRPNDGVTRLEFIDKLILEMSDQLKSEQDITAMRRYYNEFLKHADSWYGNLGLCVAVGAINDIYPTLLNHGEWPWSTFVLGAAAAYAGIYSVNLLENPWRFLVQAGAASAIIIAGHFVENYVKEKYHLP